MKNWKVVVVLALCLVSLLSCQAGAFASVVAVIAPANGSTVTTTAANPSVPVSVTLTLTAGEKVISAYNTLYLDGTGDSNYIVLSGSGANYTGTISYIAPGQHTLAYSANIAYSVGASVYNTVYSTTSEFTVNGPGPSGVTPPDAEQETALNYINSYRSECGLPPLQLNDSLDAACQTHSVYMQDNNTMTHYETQSDPGYTAVDPYQRDEYFGYGSQYDYEDIFDGPATAQAAIDGWIDTVYHRVPILDPAAVALGYGHAGAYYTIDIGFSGNSNEPSASSSNVSVFPYDGMTDAKTEFAGFETPNPLSQLGVSVSGYPISIEIGNAESGISNVSATLTSNGTTVPVFVLTPSTDTTGDLTDGVFMLAKSPLQAGTEYTASISCTAGGNSYSKTWSFTTAGSASSTPSGGITTGGGGGGGGAATATTGGGGSATGGGGAVTATTGVGETTVTTSTPATKPITTPVKTISPIGVEFMIGVDEYFVEANGQSSSAALGMDNAPYIDTTSGRTLVPVRYLANALGVTDSGIVWNPATQTVTLASNNTTISMAIGNNALEVNGQAQSMDTAPVINDGRTYLPARYVAEALKYQVDWNAQSQVVVIWPSGATEPDYSKIFDL